MAEVSHYRSHVAGESKSSEGAHRRDSEAVIHAELVAARKRPGGLSPQTMALCPVMCDLLGNGDPEVAHVELSLKLLELIEAEDDVRAIEAACYSLGLTTAADTHLARLEEFGAKHFLDQRQARRYSDRGLEQLARLISTHWTVPTVPEATLILIGVLPGQIGFTVQTRRQRHVDMRDPAVSVWQDGDKERTPLAVQWKRTSEPDALWVKDEFETPHVLVVKTETTLRVVCRGETWPKFTVVLTGDIDASTVRCETLGAACAVTVSPGPV